MEPLSLQEISSAVQGVLAASPDGVCHKVRRVCIDSRGVLPGDLFVALPGDRADGHFFVGEALDKGAVGCLVSRPVEGAPPHCLIVVEDAGKALMRLAAWYRKKISVPVLAITGSSGKSTAKEMAAHLLSLHYAVRKAPGSYNNEIGVPLTLLSWEKEVDVVVLEMAMRGKGQIAELCEIALPTHGLVTSVGKAHIGLLGSVQAIADAKGELLESLPPDGIAFLNNEDKWTPYLSRKCRCPVRTFGFGEGCHVRATAVEQTWEGTQATLVTPAGEVRILLNLLGMHNLSNFLGAASAALALGVPLEKIAEGASACPTLPGRLEIRAGAGGVRLLDDSYNANPSSLEAGMRTLASLPVEGRRILVLGDMLELGSFAQEAHATAGFNLAAMGFDALFGFGGLVEETVSCARKAGIRDVFHFSDHASLLSNLRAFVRPGDAVLIKGSRKMGMEKIADGLAGVERSGGK